MNGQDRWGIDPPWVELEQDDFIFRVAFSAAGTLRSLAIETVDDKHSPITARAVKSLRVGAVEGAARRYITRRLGAYAAAVSGPLHMADVWREPTLSDDRLHHLARVAKEYAETFGEVSQADQAEEIGRRLGYSGSSIGAMVKQARKAGLLTPTTPGKGGGSLTFKGAKVLGLVRHAWEDATPEQQKAAIELQERAGKLYSALLAGDITGDEYVQSVEHLLNSP